MSKPRGDDPVSDHAISDLLKWRDVIREVWQWRRECSAESIWQFAQGVGDDNPLWWSSARGREAGGGRMLAPPTYLYTAFSGGLPPWGLDGIQVSYDLLPGAGGLWAGDRWEFAQPTREGDVVVASTWVHEVDVSHSARLGRVVTCVERYQFETSNGELLGTCDRTLKRFARPTGPVPVFEAQRPVFSDEDLRAIDDRYAAEAAQVRGDEPRRAIKTRPGESLGTIQKGPLTVTSTVAWAMGAGSPLTQTDRMWASYRQAHPASMTHHPETNVPESLAGLHWNSELSSHVGMPRGYDYGSQRISWLSHLLTDWCGDAGRVRVLDARLRRPNLIGDLTTISGTVVGNDGSGVVQCSLEARNQRDEIIATATADVELPT